MFYIVSGIVGVILGIAFGIYYGINHVYIEIGKKNSTLSSDNPYYVPGNSRQKQSDAGISTNVAMIIGWMFFLGVSAIIVWFAIEYFKEVGFQAGLNEMFTPGSGAGGAMVIALGVFYLFGVITYSFLKSIRHAIKKNM